MKEGDALISFFLSLSLPSHRPQEIDETLQSKMSAEEEDAVQLELAAMVAEQDAARKAVSFSLHSLRLVVARSSKS